MAVRTAPFLQVCTCTKLPAALITTLLTRLHLVVVVVVVVVVACECLKLYAGGQDRSNTRNLLPPKNFGAFTAALHKNASRPPERLSLGWHFHATLAKFSFW